MLTEKDYCDYETCVALKELGYVGSRQECECFGAYFNFGNDIFTDSLDNTEVGTNEYLRVPLYLAQKWLREEKTIGVFVSGFKNGYTFWVNNLLNGDTLYQGFFDNQTGEKYKSYEEALSEGIKCAVKILKDGKGI